MTEHNKYNNSKIYKIVSASSDKIYIGSTCNTLPKRLYDHIKHYKHYTIDKTKPYTTSYEIIKLGDYSIVLAEECNFNNKQQLHEREGHYIKSHRDICVNKVIAGRTYSEYDNRQSAKINEVTYTGTTGVTYTSFKTFSIKVVLTSSDPAIVPSVKDLRIIATPAE